MGAVGEPQLDLTGTGIVPRFSITTSAGVAAGVGRRRSATDGAPAAALAEDAAGRAVAPTIAVRTAKSTPPGCWNAGCTNQSRSSPSDASRLATDRRRSGGGTPRSWRSAHRRERSARPIDHGLSVRSAAAVLV
jgi:hypothetical protein